MVTLLLKVERHFENHAQICRNGSIIQSLQNILNDKLTNLIRSSGLCLSCEGKYLELVFILIDFVCVRI